MESYALYIKAKEPTVPCKHCQQATTFTGTRMCNRCWELEHRIGNDMELAEKILNYLKTEEH